MRNFAILHLLNYISSKYNIKCCKISKTNSIIFHNNFSFRFDHSFPPRPEGSYPCSVQLPFGAGGKHGQNGISNRNIFFKSIMAKRSFDSAVQPAI